MAEEQNTHKGKFIGEKKIAEVSETEEKTPGGLAILQVRYEDGAVEWLSSKMLEATVSEESCDLGALREKRTHPVIQEMLVAIREWGIKLGELPYMSATLNQSLDFNQREALLELWSNWMPRPLSPDEIDFVAIDRVLKSRKVTINDILKPNNQ